MGWFRRFSRHLALGALPGRVSDLAQEAYQWAAGFLLEG